MNGRAIALGRVVTMPPPGARPDGARGRIVPNDIDQLWTQGTTDGQSAAQQATAHIARSIVILPPEFLQPPEATSFQPYLLQNTAAVGVTQLWTFVVPRSSVLIIKDLDCFAGPTTSASDLNFQLTVNGAPWPGYGNMRLFPGAASINSRSFNDLTLRFTEGMTVGVQLSNNDGGTYNVAAGAQGWYYPRTVADMYTAMMGGTL